MRSAHWIIIISMIVLAGFISYSFASRKPPVGPDNCRLDGMIPAHTVFILDQSDPFSEADIQWVNELIRRESFRLQESGRFTVLSMNPESDETGGVIFSRCSPGAPGFFTGITRNERITQQDWRDNFELDLQERIRFAMLRKRADNSPLFETFERILRRPDFSPYIEGRRLLIVSDLAQNSPVYSHYTDPLDWESFKQKTDYTGVNRYEDVKIVMHVAERRNGPDQESLRQFWRTYFEEVGGGSVEFIIEY